ncbi:hypothetical protein AB0B25_07235 [Nocardia sp. NPDC049190]|uniref:hypothetical protein n=1 Tax=Nocardia sp. NPDC049190 TaxID=3155650 RepID=UPI0033EC6542
MTYPGHPPSPSVGPVTTTKDKDPWKDIAAYTKAPKDPLRFEFWAAQKAANQCSEAIGGILRVQEKIAAMVPLRQLSQLDSGDLLAIQCNDTLGGLSEVLRTHEAMLTEMMDTFIAAGKKYIQTDLESAGGYDEKTRKWMLGDLDRIRAEVPKKGGKFVTKAPELGKDPKIVKIDDEDRVDPTGRDFTEVPKTDGIENVFGDVEPSDVVKPAAIPGKVMDYAGSTQTQREPLHQDRLETGPNPENPANQQWRDLHDLGLSTGLAIKPVREATRDWKWMALELDDAVGAFAENIANTTKDDWSGTGADKAIGAVKKYHAKAVDLTSRMNAVSSLLDYTGKWLKSTKEGMPPDPKPPPAKMVTTFDEMGGSYSYLDPTQADKNQRNLAIYRQNMENSYVLGVQTSSLFMPTLNELPTNRTSIPKGKAANPADKTGDRGPYTGGGPGGGPGYAPTGYTPTGYTPTRTPQSFGNDLVPSAAGGPDTSPTGTKATDRTITTTTTVPDSASQAANGLSQAADMAQQGVQQGMNAAAQAAQAAQQAAAMGSGLDSLNNAARAAGLPGLGTPGGTGGLSAGKVGGIGGAGAAAAALQKEAEAARLFPRANLAGPAGSALGRLGIPGSGIAAAGAPGSPGPAGAGAGQGQGQGKDHKRANYLDSKTHLEEALGDAPTVVRAVVEK